MVNIQDVAKEAGVSVATVSRVINNIPSVAEKTRDRVLDAINRLNYQPNLLGRNLRRSETRMVLVLLPNISNPFYSLIVKGIEDVGHKNGYNVMLCNTDSDENRERIYLELLKNKLSDGVIFMAPEISQDELSQIGESFPVVQCCEYKEGARVSHVSIDNFAAAYEAVKYLINLGHKRIGMISCNNSYVSTIRREAGYKQALRDFDITFDHELIKYGDYGFKSGLSAANQFFLMDKKPTAIFSISDVMAIGAIRGFNEKGYKVPEDVSVIGFDNISFAGMYNPPLTTISQPQYELGCTAMEMLLNKIKMGVDSSQSVKLSYELIVRKSTSEYK